MAAALAIHFANRPDPAPHDPGAAAWIELPRSGMDASTPEIRALMLPHFDRPDPDALSITCGSLFRAETHGERYIAHIGSDAWHPGWKVVMDVRGDDILFSWQDLAAPPPSQSQSMPGIRLVEPVSTLSKPRAEVEVIRSLWNDEALWHAPQDRAAFACNDGNPVSLEACVDGRYGARARNCNAAADVATRKLWRAFNTLLPAPGKPEWRDEDGNRVEPGERR